MRSSEETLKFMFHVIHLETAIFKGDSLSNKFNCMLPPLFILF